MTKENPTISKMETTSLTEQWKNGELKEGWYYLSIVPSKKCIDYYYGKDFVRYNEWAITKVLASLPSYDQFIELTEKANQFSQLVKKVDEVGEKFRFLHKSNKLSKDEETALKSIIFANELETKCNQLEQEIEKLEKLLDIAVKTLKEYADEENWSTATTEINTDYFEFECSMYGLEHNGFEDAQKALKEIELVNNKLQAKEEI